MSLEKMPSRRWQDLTEKRRKTRLLTQPPSNPKDNFLACCCEAIHQTLSCSFCPLLLCHHTLIAQLLLLGISSFTLLMCQRLDRIRFYDVSYPQCPRLMLHASLMIESEARRRPKGADFTLVT